MSEVSYMSKYHFIITPDGERKFLASDMPYIEGKAADFLLDQLAHGKRSTEAEERARKEIAEEDARLRALARNGIPF